MIFKILVGQRKEDYEGQYAPEALEVVDGYTDDENPEWIANKLKQAQLDKSFESLKVIDVKVDSKAIMAILRPNTEVKGTLA